MMSLLDLISQNQPHFQTHQALLVIGLQNDFIDPDGRLPVNTSNHAFLHRIKEIVPKFRQTSSNIIWVQTLYEADRLASDPATGEGDAVVVGGLVDGVESSTDDDDDLPKDVVTPTQSRSSRHKQRALDLLKKVSSRKKLAPVEVAQAAADADEELFLFRSNKRPPACLPNTPGADFAEAIKSSIEPSDAVLTTTNYSAFLGTKLLLILRAKLVTELYICGCITNVSVLASVIDAARHGIRINVVTDCLGYRKRSRHDEALKRMVDFLDANMVTSEDVLNPDRERDDQEQEEEESGADGTEERLEDLVDRLRLRTRTPTSQANSRKSSLQSPAISINGRQRTISDASAVESRATTDTKLSDDQFSDMLVKGAIIPTEERAPAAVKQKMVKSKIRMRSRSDKKKEEDKKSKKESDKKGESSKKGEPSARQATEAPTPQPPKSPREAVPPSHTTPRVSAITKAESSDKLRDGPVKPEQALKSSASQPALSSNSVEGKGIKKSPSRMRLALSRSSRSDSNKVLPAQPQKSPTKVVEESPHIPQVKIAPETPQKNSVKASTAPPVAPTTPGTPTPTPSAKPPTMGKKLQSLATFPVMRPGDRIAEGDSRIIYDFFPSDLRHPTNRSKPLKDLIFQQLYNEVRWQKMLHQQGEVPRLVCCQGEFGADGSMPVYRHPTDQALPLLHFSPKVQFIRKQAEKLAGHPLNHVLIQLYRSGNDYISEHSDKTLDIVRGSSIVNVSFGAQRTMRLRTKKAATTTPSKAEDGADNRNGEQRETQRVAMPHNSMFVLGLESNKKWLHGINADKRLEAERSDEERAYGGMRISLTFRHIGTFLDAANEKVWGQGATGKTVNESQDVINEDEEENEKVVRAFSKENHNSDFDWEEWYGEGFDVLHFRNAPKDVPILFGSNNPVENKQIQLFLAEKGINHLFLEAPTMDKTFEFDRQVCFRDNDVNHTETVVPVPILLYLDRYNPLDRDHRGRACTARSMEIFILVTALLKAWFNRHVPTYFNEFINTLEVLEEKQAMGPGPFIAGRRFSTGDCAMWPAIDELVTNFDGWSAERFPALAEYYKMLLKKKSKSVGKFKEAPPKTENHVVPELPVEVDDE
jgi:nicotinamidase-related amidase/alkylated DNA repair dioxygenase AlkB